MTMEDYVVFRSNPANDNITDGQWAASNDLSIVGLRQWKADNPAKMTQILEKRRGSYAEKLIEVDQALFEKAKGGDARAIELLWSRFEGWTPKIEEAAARHGNGRRTLADLMGEL